jgi:thiaminase/transcriptional activator TenA
MRRAAIALVVILLGLGVFAGGLAWVLDVPKPPAGTPHVERLYLGLCATCHGVDGRGSWRATLFLIRPGDLADPARMRAHTDQYLFDVIKHGGAPLGRPGMPAFGASLGDDDIRRLVAYLRSLSGAPRRSLGAPNVRGAWGALRGPPDGRPSMAFTDELWRAIETIYAAILRHPFLTGLTDGSLPRERFRFYAVQDALYLREFARGLSIAAARAPRDEWIIMFNEHAAEALRVERALHEGFFSEFGLTADDVAATPLAPTNLAYTSYLLAVAYGRPFHEAVAALLPCYWIYWEVGKALERAGSRDPLYARWIGTYASDAFGDIVRAVLTATNVMALSVGPAERDAMRQHFLTTSRYEWMFWDMGHRQERWPL